MSVSLSVKAYSSKENEKYKKHYNAVKFCIENDLSYPKETSEFFKGKVGGGDLEDYLPEYVLKYIENGIEIPLSLEHKDYYSAVIKVSQIPKEVDTIKIELT